eukprot:CAMPEP_0173394518 /NCGR_PEP_ID=MMETSP1356-20130122/27900_1 /TAXON_ID=77927 ORGANISM="Hemiselmis virescens, Strain PCC157" /NCGR_SAMPLE_ID=MMETSP1356 /ASSEMBLY_ACC=CAM_ASM_000847 /LENGTH=429 /DNA_ID=CAMNT_0014352919 /DNA_START=1 /DNA_END=1290 /DNA_ORIENTATION=+
MLKLSLFLAISLEGASAFMPSPMLRAPSGRLSSRSARAVTVPRMTLAIPPPKDTDLTDALPDCPATIWNTENIDVAAEQAKYRAMDLPDSPLYITATPADVEKGFAYFEENKEMIMAKLKEHGAVLFKGFEVTKNPKGFREAWTALGLNPCLDPIHTSGLRSFLDAQNGVYEEVNKKSLQQHYIGLHNESTFKKTATFGAFVCFSPASEGGGEFFIADGAKIFRDLRTDLLEKFYKDQVRISVSNLDLGFLEGLGGLKEKGMETVKNIVSTAVAPKFDMDLDMIYGADGKPMRLQAVEHRQSPINRHPDTGMPVWFCNIHNHARYLRDNRPCTVPEVGMTEVYYGDLSHIAPADLDHINEVSNKHIVDFKMEKGDVLLVDNYRVLHGRDIFEGDRLHAVSWFRKGDEPVNLVKPDNFFNSLINGAISWK